MNFYDDGIMAKFYVKFQSLATPFIYFKVSEGRFGDPILDFHTERMKEDLSNKAKLACDILKSYK